MTVERSLRGDRRVEVIRPDGSRVVTMGRTGFVERTLPSGLISRTYIVGGQSQVRVYRAFSYGGVRYYAYAPGMYYHPAFYGWAINPWTGGVAYGWGPAPWYGFYGGYFAPSPMYPGASYWLTDYAFEQNLNAAYENQLAAGGTPAEAVPQTASNSVTLTPEVKQMIAEEVQQQLEMERAESAQRTNAANALPPQGPPALDAKMRLFIVSASMDLTDPASGQTCSVTPGDVIERQGRDVSPEGTVPVTVLSSKAGDCQAEFASTLDIGALQEMHNQFHEQLDNGMQKLATIQGKYGIPAGPLPGSRLVSERQAPPAPDAAALVAQQMRDADRTEADVKQQVPDSGNQ